MNDPEWRRRVEDLCDAALEHDASERSAFVASACEGDDGLRHDVEALLAHADRAEGFLERPIGAVAASVLAETHGALLVGRQIGSYRILSLIGAGGMGEVYRARDTKLGRDVAVKVVAEAFLSSPERRARLEREAHVLATLNHPHIGAIYGLEEADGIRGLILELVEGATLAARLAVGASSIQESLDIARQIADALDAAHERGIIHRDLKPANVTIRPDGTVKVLDFGLAKVFSSEESGEAAAPIVSIPAAGTVDGVIAGTASYMSPEQARGKPVDKRTDIWAFGCVLYETLTAQPAFAGETVPETIRAVIEQEPDWNALPAQTPASIRRLLKRCLEKDQKRRLRDIGDARLEVEEALAAMVSPHGADPERAAVDRLSMSPRPTRLVTWAAAIVALVIIGAAATWQLRRSEYFWRNPLEGITATRLTYFGGAEHHAAISPSGDVVAFLSDRDGTWDAWVIQVDTGNYRNLTNRTVAELRNPATRTVNFSPDGTEVMLWSRTRKSSGGGVVDSGWTVPTIGGQLQPSWKGLGISELAWARDGRRVYHLPTPGDPLFVIDHAERPEDKREPIYAAGEGVHNHFPIWSHDGSYIYFVQGKVLDSDFYESDVWRIRPKRGQPERMTFHNTRVTFPTLLDNQTLLYLATDENGSGPWIYGMNVERGVAHRISLGVEAYTSLAASDDGRRVVATVSRSTAGVWRVPIGDSETESDATPIRRATSGLSPRRGDGYIIYRAPKAGTYGLRKLTDSGEETELWNGLDGRVVAGVAIEPGGRRLALPVQRGGRTQLYVVNADGTGEARPVSQQLDVRGAPAWSPDGRWLAVAANLGDEPRLFKIPVDGGEPVLLVNEYATNPVWAPSGRFLVYFGADVGTNFPVKAVNDDGAARRVPAMKLTRGDHLAFLGTDDTALIILKGDVSQKEFYRVDLGTGHERPLTNLGREFAIGDFDVSPDGRELVFDRVREESDIVLFDGRNR